MEQAIVVIHKGKGWYLKYVLSQLRVWNPKARIVLLTDKPYRLYKTLCEVHLLGDYFEGARDFEKVYEHLSPNPYGYELFCFQRWFALLEFMRRQNLKRVYHLDSDVMIYCDLWQDAKSYQAFDLVNTGWQGPQSMLINSPDVLEAYCAFTTTQYRDHVTEMKESYAQWQAEGLVGGVSDMHTLHEFIAEGRYRFDDNSQVLERKAFDININESNGYEMAEGTKAIQYKNGIPYGKLEASGEPVAFKGLHFQGGSKIKILENLNSLSSGRRGLLRVWSKLEKLGWL